MGRPLTQKELEQSQLQKWLLSYAASQPRTNLDDENRDYDKFYHTFGVYLNADENTYKVGLTPVSWEGPGFVIEAKIIQEQLDNTK